MATPAFRSVLPLALCLAATAVLSFVAGAMVTAWALSGERQARAASPHLAFETVLADEPGRLRLALAPATRVSPAEAAALAPEIFPPAAEDGVETADSRPYTLHLGTYLKYEQAEAARRDAEALGLPAVTRMLVDVRGRAWFSVQAGRYGDLLSAALAARSFDGAHAVALPDWSRG